jgi:isopentenyl diphosphate isomerase/L-lactate dehydrogenase-like FMN-dependent dehydrogenase
LSDFREAAKLKLAKAAFEYIDSGSGEEQTLKSNESSFHKLMIIPRILNSTSVPDLSTNMFGRVLKLPFGFAPWAMNVMCHPDGETIPAKIANERNIMMCLSSLSSKSLGEVSETNQKGIRFMQMYVTSDW